VNTINSNNFYPVKSESYLTRAINLLTSVHVRIALLIFWTLLAGLFLYNTSITSVIGAVLHRQGSSHGVFVPFLSGIFLWMNRSSLREIELRYDYIGIPLLLIGVFFPLFTIGTYHIQFLSFIVFVAGLIIIHLGRKYFKEISFPLLFLITMIPLPEHMHLTLANYTRNISFGGSSWIISLFGIPFMKEGLLIHLPDAVLKVNLGCSGIRYLISFFVFVISFFVFGIAYAYLYRKTTWSRLIIIGLTIPISLAASILRLTAIFLLTFIFGPHMAEYWPHVFISWSVFFAILILSVASDRFFQTRYSETHA
jgi:exosortase